jgi:hypothetical protein
MQQLWSRSLRPQSTCRCLSCTNTLPGISSRRTTSRVARRRFRRGDAFTLLLGPVLGGALIADSQAKDKRRRAWDDRIAAVREEVEELRHGRLMKPYSLTSRNLRRLPGLSRSYSSMAPAQPLKPAGEVEDSDDGDDNWAIDALDWQPNGETNRPSQVSLIEPSHKTTHNDLAATTERAQMKAKISPETIQSCKRVQRLVAVKLALNVIVHIHLGRNLLYTDSGLDYCDYHSLLPQDMNVLTRDLKEVCDTLQHLRLSKSPAIWDAYQTRTRGCSCALDGAIPRLALQFERGEMDVAHLAMRFANALLSSSESPNARTYINFLKVVSRARFNDLSLLVEGAIWEARLPLDYHSIFNLFWRYGLCRDLRRMERLIEKLTGERAHGLFGERWRWKTINGILVPVPPSQHPRMVHILVYCALRCNQPHRAKAWSTLLAETHVCSRAISQVITAFLTYYSSHGTWSKGLIWLRVALDKSELLAAQSLRDLQRVVLAMLSFCTAHGNDGLYREIMNAACECRLGIYEADSDPASSHASGRILEEWQWRISMIQRGSTDDFSSAEKAQRFSRKLRHIRHSEIDSKSHEVNSEETPEPEVLVSGEPHQELEASHWKSLCSQQAAQLDLLKNQLESLRMTLEFRSPLVAIDDGAPSSVDVGTISETLDGKPAKPNEARKRYPPNEDTPENDQPFVPREQTVYTPASVHCLSRERDPGPISSVSKEQTIPWRPLQTTSYSRPSLLGGEGRLQQCKRPSQYRDYSTQASSLQTHVISTATSKKFVDKQLASATLLQSPIGILSRDISEIIRVLELCIDTAHHIFATVRIPNAPKSTTPTSTAAPKTGDDNDDNNNNNLFAELIRRILTPEKSK